MTSIPIDPKKGLDPHMTYCPRCGGETNELVVGVVMKAELPNGQFAYANRGRTKQAAETCVKAGAIQNIYELNWKKVEDSYEKLPASQPCTKCLKELEAFENEVKAGGVYFRCKECGMQGVVKAGTPLAQMVRKEMKVEPPKPCGVELSKCVEHGGPRPAQMEA